MQRMQDFYDAGLTNSVRTKSRIDLASMGTELVYSNFAPSPKIPTTTKEVLLKHADNRQQARILAACLPDSLVLEFKGTKRSYQRLDAAERAKGEIQLDEASLLQQPYVWYKDDDGRNVLISPRFEIPVSPLQEDYFLQKEFFAYVHEQPRNTDGGRVLPHRAEKFLAVVYDWKPEAVKKASTDLPISFMDLISPDSHYNYPEPTQMVDFLSRLVHVADRTHADLYVEFALDSVYILNPSVLEGGDKHLLFRICPHSVGLRKELPAGVTPHMITRRTLAEFMLLAISRLKSYSSTLLAPRLGKAFKESPGLAALFMEVMEQSNLQWNPSGIESRSDRPLSDVEKERTSSNTANAKAHPESVPAIAAGVTSSLPSLTHSSAPSSEPMKPSTPDKLTERCPSAQCFSKLRDKNPETARKFEFGPDHVPALLSGMLCHRSPHIHTLASDGLWKLIKRAGKRELGLTIGVATECAHILVPGLPGQATGLADPTSATKSEVWVSRMLIIDRVLYENERSADYGRLRRLQQALVEAGIAHQLGGSLIGHNERFTLKVLVPIVRVSTLMAFQFPNLAARLIFHRNVRRMSKMCIDAGAKGILHNDDLQRYVALMLVISDFGEWIDPGVNALQGGTKEQQEDAALLKIWEDLDQDIFLLSALPAWMPSMSDKTSARIAAKFGPILDRLLNEYTTVLEEKEKAQALKKVSYALDWHMQFAWNAPEQVSTASFKSLYTSSFMALITCKHNSTLILDNPDWEASRKEYVPLAPVPVETLEVTSGTVQLRDRNENTLKGAPKKQSAHHDDIPSIQEQDSSGSSSGSSPYHAGSSFSAFYSITSSGSDSSTSTASTATSSSSSSSSSLKGAPKKQSAHHDDIPSIQEQVSSGSSSGSSSGPYHAGPSFSAFYSIPSSGSDSSTSTASTATSSSSSSSSSSSAPRSGPSSSSSAPNSSSSVDHHRVEVTSESAAADALEKDSLPPREIKIASKPIDRNFDSRPEIEEALKLAQPKNPSNPENQEYLMTTHKYPIKSNELASFAKYCLDRAVASFYVPKPRNAPVTEESIVFNVPGYRTDFCYQENDITSTEIVPPVGMESVAVKSAKHNSLRSLMYNEVRREREARFIEGKYKFIPITVGALSRPLCSTKGEVPMELGTTGMVEFTLADTGDLNRVMFGLTWDAAADSCTPRPIGLACEKPGYKLPPSGLEYLVPGHSKTSVGFDISTGCVHYWDSTGRKVDPGIYRDVLKHGVNSMPAPFDDHLTPEEADHLLKVPYLKKAPYAPPVGTGSKVALCVAYDRVFLIIDSVFYPPIPNLVIPHGVKIHALLRFEASGTKVSQRCLTDTWRVVRNLDGALSDTTYNPLAHLMYLAELRTKVCPHYHGNRKPADTRPQVTQFFNSETYKSLPDAIKQRLELIDLATRPCGADDCQAPHILNDLINRIIAESRVAAAQAAAAAAK